MYLSFMSAYFAPYGKLYTKHNSPPNLEIFFSISEDFQHLENVYITAYISPPQ